MSSSEILQPDTNRRPFPIQSYAALGDGRSLALLSPDGTVVWWCAPNLDSAPLLDALLDSDAGGFFSLQPVEPFRSERRYRKNSNVLETTFTTPSGMVRVTESMNSTLAGRLPWCELARRLEGIKGCVRMRARIVFGTHAATVSPWLQRHENGSAFHVGPLLGTMRMSSNMQVEAEDDRSITLQVTLQEGERAVVAAVAAESEPLGIPSVEDIDKRIDLSDKAWANWSSGLIYHGPYREILTRSALALKLLLFSPTGAIAAAGTTSAPEHIGGLKNYDYRYAWVRDACYTLDAFLRLGQIPEAQAALACLMLCLAESGPKVCYRLDGSPVPEVQQLDLPGFMGSKPVVTGNQAGAQWQHGVYGDMFKPLPYSLQAVAFWTREAPRCCRALRMIALTGGVSKIRGYGNSRKYGITRCRRSAAGKL